MSRKTTGTWAKSSWRNIFDNSIVIPMNQRNYEWNEINVNKFLEDAIDIFENTQFSEVMGSLIIYNSPDGKECFDGQQRIITTILSLCAIITIFKSMGDVNFADYIYTLITEDLRLAPVITSRMNDFTDKYGVDKKMPKVHCISPDDDEALCDIFNGYEPLLNFKDCKTCNLKFKTDTKFINHMVKLHDYIDSKNKIYIAFNTLCKTLHSKNFEINKIKDFVKFLMNHVEVQVYDTDNSDYACRLFEWTNNRGAPVTSLDVRKNAILSRVTDYAKIKVFDKWNEIKSSTNGEQILNCSLQIYNGVIKREIPQINSLLRETKVET